MLKQKITIFTALILLGISIVTVFVTVPSANALTKEQWQECQDEFQGLELVNTPESRTKWEKFKADKCHASQGGNCGSTNNGLSGTYLVLTADCPLSDKYIEEWKNGGGEVETVSPNGTQSCGGVDTAVVSCSGGSGSGSGLWGIMLLVINIMTAGVFLAAVGGFVYGAILYTSAQDNASQVSKAKETMFNVILGLILYAMMYALLQFIIPGGIFK